MIAHLEPGFQSSRCLRLRSRFSECERCARACSAQALRVTGDALELTEACMRCGRCAAVCPTGALQLDGFAPVLPRLDSPSDSPLYLECWKVPASEPLGETIRVPCLGGIAAHHLVQWHMASNGRALVLLDRGWCAQCAAGGRANHPAELVLHAVRSLLAELGVPDPFLPRLETRLQPRAQMPSEIPEPLAAQPLNRREFFYRLARGAARTVAQVTKGGPDASTESPPALGRKLVPAARIELLEAAEVVAAQHGRSLPASLYPTVRVSDRCCNHQVCVSSCPTGALRSYERTDTSLAGISFDASACIGCGDCERACPEHALTLEPAGGSAISQAPMALTRWTLRECRGCGYEFADSGAGNLCPACRKTRELSRASFDQLFGPGRNADEARG